MDVTFSEIDSDRIIEMAWENRTSLEAMERWFGISQPGVIILRRKMLSLKSFRRKRKPTNSRTTGKIRKWQVAGDVNHC